MISSFFHSAVYQPLYNALAFFVDWVPGGDVGVAIILITIIIKLVLLPLGIRASRTQHAMRDLDPELRAIKEKNKGNNEALARETLALYKAHGVRPFASIAMLLLQIPIILGLYWVILAEGTGGTFDAALLYPFVSVPGAASFSFLGLIPLASGSILLAVLVAATQFWLSRLMMPVAPVATGKSFQDDLAASMHLQMRYVFPVILGVVAYVAGAAIALYFVTANIFGIMQEIIARRLHLEEKHG